MFAAFDANGDGGISAEEFKQVLPMLGLTVASSEVEDMFRKFDTSGDGVLNYEELRKMLRLAHTQKHIKPSSRAESSKESGETHSFPKFGSSNHSQHHQGSSWSVEKGAKHKEPKKGKPNLAGLDKGGTKRLSSIIDPTPHTIAKAGRFRYKPGVKVRPSRAAFRGVSSCVLSPFMH